MTFYDDPNRQVLGLQPIWSGVGSDEPPTPEPEPEPDEPTAKVKADA